MMDKTSILTYLTNVKSVYLEEGFLIKALFGSYFSKAIGLPADLAGSTGMGKTGKKVYYRATCKSQLEILLKSA